MVCPRLPRTWRCYAAPAMAWTHLRSLDLGRATARAVGERARVFYLGELDPEDPPSCFKGPDRIRLSTVPALAELVGRHAEELLAAGYEEDSRYPPAFCCLGDGTRLTHT